MRMPKTSSGAVSTGDGTACPVAPQMIVASASSTMPKPIVPISIRSKSLFSNGRSTRSMTSPMSPVTAMATGIADEERQVRRHVEGGRRVGADHDHLAVGEVDQAHGAVDDREPHRDQRVDGAEPSPPTSVWKKTCMSPRPGRSRGGMACPVRDGSAAVRRRACRGDDADRGGVDADAGLVEGEVAEQPVVLGRRIASASSSPVAPLLFFSAVKHDVRAVVGLRAVQSRLPRRAPPCRPWRTLATRRRCRCSGTAS